MAISVQKSVLNELSTVMLDQEDAVVQEAEHVAYLRVSEVDPTLYSMYEICITLLESIARDGDPDELPESSISTKVQEALDVHVEEQVAYVRLPDAPEYATCKTPFESITIDVLVAWWLYSVVLRVIFTHEPLASVAYLRTLLVSSK